jgi:hypothetical protein
MSEQYFIDCTCGKQLRVELFEAGTQKTCPACGTSVPVPSITKLKELSGDKYPLLGPIDKIRRTLSNDEPPFDGPCHVCGAARADYDVPIHFNVLVERHVEEGGGIRPTIDGGLKLVAGASEETWETTTFPLMLCAQCHARFESEYFRARIRSLIKTFGLVALLGAFLYFAYYNAELIAALVGILSLIGAIAWAAQFRQSKKAPPFIANWLRHIRWATDAIAAEDEYKLTIGQSCIRENASHAKEHLDGH